MSLLVRAGRQGKVSFDDIRRDTGMSIHPIRRAANWLEAHGLGAVRPITSDKRRRRFHINKEGKNLLKAIETETARAVQEHIGAAFDGSERYYQFTFHLWNLTRFLPEAGCGNDEYFFPTDISADSSLDPLTDYFRPLVEPLRARRRVAVHKHDAEPD
jgi:DNA-binding MarR family transcriptional regulator